MPHRVHFIHFLLQLHKANRLIKAIQYALISLRQIGSIKRRILVILFVIVAFQTKAQTITNISIKTVNTSPICANRNFLVTFDVNNLASPSSISFILSNNTGNFNTGTRTLDIVSPATFPASGSVAAVLTLPTRAPGTAYLLRITDGISATGTSAPISISGTNTDAPADNPRFTTASKTICSTPFNLTITIPASVTRNASYQLFKVDGSNIGSSVAGNSDGIVASTIEVGPINSVGIYRAFVSNEVCTALISSNAAGGPEVTVTSANDAQINNIINNPICSGQSTYSVHADVSNANTYQWEFSSNGTTWNSYNNNNNTSGSNTPTLTLTGNQIVPGRQLRIRVSNSTCTAPIELTSTVTSITVNSNPTVTIVPSNTAICQGTSVLFTAAVTTTATGATSYTWSPTNETTSTISNDGSVAGTFPYSVTITDSNGCTAASSTISLTVSQAPVPPTSVSSLNTNVQLSPTSFSICEGTSLTMITTCAVGTPHWDGPSISGMVTSTSATFSPTGNANGTVRSYTIVCSSAGCPTSSPFLFTVTVYQPNPPTIVSSNTAVCSGSSLTLTATNTGAGSPFVYIWSAGIVSGGTSNSATAIQTSAIGTQTYSVTVTSNRGCTNTQSTTVLVNQTPESPTLSASTSTSVCTNGGSGQVSLTAAGCTNSTEFIVSGPNQGISSGGSLTLSAIGSYTVLARCISASPASCSSSLSDPQYVTIYDNPTVSLAANPSIAECVGTSLTLLATPTAGSNGSNSFVYSFGGINQPQNFTTIINPSSATTYSVVITDGNSCTGANSITLSPKALPTITITGNLTICSGESTTLAVSGGASYTWNTNSNDNPYIVAPSATTNYTITATDVNGCSNTTTATVTVNPALTALITASSLTICAGQSATLTASGGTGFLWDNASNSPNITVTPTATTTYSVIVTSGSCSASTTATITVNPAVTATIGSAQTICAGQTVTLTAGGGNTYSWDHGLPASSTVTATPTITTTFNVSVTNTTTGCSSATSVTVTVNPAVTATISGNLAICTGGSTTLTAGGGTSFSWSNGQSTTAIIVSPQSATAYSVTVTSLSTGCSSTTSVTVTVNPAVTATISGNLTICQGESTTLTASGGSGFSWSTGSAGASIIVNPVGTTAYSITVSSGSCFSTASVTITVKTTPTVSITPISSLVPAGQTVTLTASGATSYIWSTNETTNPISVSSASAGNVIYSVTGVTNGCSGTASAAVSYTTPCGNLTSISVSQSGFMCNGSGNITITATAPGATSYSLISSQGTQLMPNGLLSVTQAGSYTILAGNMTGCVVSQVIIIPNTNQQPLISNLVADGPLSTTHCAAILTAQTTGLSFVVTGPNGYVFSSVYRNSGSYKFTALKATIPGTYILKAYLGNCQTQAQVIVTGTACP